MMKSSSLSLSHSLCFVVDILLNPTGNVPILKTRKWAVEPDKPVSSIIRFIHKYLKLDAEDKLVGLMHKALQFPQFAYDTTIVLISVIFKISCFSFCM